MNIATMTKYALCLTSMTTLTACQHLQLAPHPIPFEIKTKAPVKSSAVAPSAPSTQQK